MLLKEKTVIVTGAGQGIGRVYAKRLSLEGANVVAADINEENAKNVAEEISLAGGRCIAVQVDVSDKESTEKMAKATLEEFGNISVLLNNASIFSSIKMKPFDQISVEEWDQLMAVNLKGLLLCCQAVAPTMKENNRGKIINISSGTIFMGRPNYIHYVTSKAGVIGFSRCLAKELGDWNINVNAVTLGATKTEVPRETVSPEQAKNMINQQCIKRQQVPNDLEGTIVFLASDLSDFITGQIINVDGGLNFH